jgi:hypothetical protein
VRSTHYRAGRVFRSVSAQAQCMHQSQTAEILGLAWPSPYPPPPVAPPPRPLLAGSGSCPKLAGQRHHHHLFVSSPRPHAREVGRTVVSPLTCRGWRRLSRCCRGAPPGCHSTAAHPLSAPRLIASGSFGPGLTVTITRSSFAFEPPAPGPRALASPLAPRSRECYRSPRTGHTATATFHWTGLDGGSFVRRGAAQRHRRNLRRR